MATTSRRACACAAFAATGLEATLGVALATALGALALAVLALARLASLIRRFLLFCVARSFPGSTVLVSIALFFYCTVVNTRCLASKFFAQILKLA